MLTPRTVVFSVIVITAVVLIAGSPTGDGSDVLCSIPNEAEQGVCVPPKTCRAFQEINRAVDMGDAGRLSFIRKLHCGNDHRAMICCPRHFGTYLSPQLSTDVGPRFMVASRVSLWSNEIDDECGIQGVGDRILGKIADIDEFPWAALLLYAGKTPGCGGVLISRRFVLTAAHCLVGIGMNNTLEFVRLREYNLNADKDCQVETEGLYCIDGGTIDERPLSIKIHPQYRADTFKHHDIGLIEISLNEEFSEFLRPICLPEAGRLTGLKSGAFLTVCGWGMTDFFSVQEKLGFASSPVKMKTTLPFVEQAKCMEDYAEKGLRLARGQICAGGRREDSCAGDSGSPLMYYDRHQGVWVLSGIVSIGVKQCGTVGKPGIYTSVVEYLPWIKRNAGL